MMTGEAYAHLIEQPDHLRREDRVFPKFLVSFNEGRNLPDPLIQIAPVAREKVGIERWTVAI